MRTFGVIQSQHRFLRQHHKLLEIIGNKKIRIHGVVSNTIISDNVYCDAGERKSEGFLSNYVLNPINQGALSTMVKMCKVLKISNTKKPGYQRQPGSTQDP